MLITHQLRPQLHLLQGTEGAEGLAAKLVHSSAIKASTQTHVQKQSILPLDPPDLSSTMVISTGRSKQHTAKVTMVLKYLRKGLKE